MSIEGLLQELQAALESNDSEWLIRIFHSIKSAANNVGAIRLANLGSGLEKQARSADTANLKIQTPQLSVEFMKSKAELENIVRN
jgi:HPt (histidine-containing phosphotransfer) domain-containing protein